jgi:hypothetical protein
VVHDSRRPRVEGFAPGSNAFQRVKLPSAPNLYSSTPFAGWFRGEARGVPTCAERRSRRRLTSRWGQRRHRCPAKAVRDAVPSSVRNHKG